MLTLALLLAAPAQAGDVVIVTNNQWSRDLTDYSDCDDPNCIEDADGDGHDDSRPLALRHDSPHPPPPQPAAIVSESRKAQLRARYAMHFLPEMPAHYIGLRHIGEKDAYLSGELRYLPASDLMWTGRAGAGVDIFGEGNWDLTAGLFIGTNGEWERSDASRVLYAAPMAGAEIGFGIDTERVFAKYRWLWGLGSGPLDDALTENELTVGYKLTDTLHFFGQYIHVNPGERVRQGGVGLGVQAVF